MIRSFVCVKPFSLSTFYVVNCARTLHSVDIQIGDIFELQESAKGVDPGNVILTYESTRFGESRHPIPCTFIEISEEYLFEHFKELKCALNYAMCTSSCTIQTLRSPLNEKEVQFEIGEIVTFYRNYSDTVLLHKFCSDEWEYGVLKTDFEKSFSTIYTAKP